MRMALMDVDATGGGEGGGEGEGSGVGSGVDSGVAAAAGGTVLDTFHHSLGGFDSRCDRRVGSGAGDLPRRALPRRAAGGAAGGEAGTLTWGTGGGAAGAGAGAAAGTAGGSGSVSMREGLDGMVGCEVVVSSSQGSSGNAEGMPEAGGGVGGCPRTWSRSGSMVESNLGPGK